MITAKVTGSMPQVAPVSTLMEQLSARMEKDVLTDVENGGNPLWQQRINPPGPATLGYIPRTIQHSNTENTATVAWGAGLPYAKVHEMGWEIPRKLGMKKFFWAKFFWAKYYGTGEELEFWKNMAISNKPTVSEPQRSVLPGILSRTEQYMEFLKEQISVVHAVPIH